MIATDRGAALEELRFDNTFAHLPPAFWQRIAPTPVPDPVLAAFSADAARLLGLRAGEETRERFLGFVSGNAPLPGCEPVAAIYAGHQFGTFVPQLGDGRAILLGEVVTASGRRCEVQLKGSGRTAFSRFGDGRAVLRSTIREFLCSEAMHHLGIPTTRALAAVASSEPVLRESLETAAVLTRLAPSFVRFGSFELFYYRGQYDEVRRLADFVIAHDFPRLRDDEDRYAQLFAAVVERTAELMALWQAVGFAHGVMNTDNMSILGLTLDYGPFGFMEAYDPGFICNHSDDMGRYAFDRQPTIGLWNCYALANALGSLVEKTDLEAGLARYKDVYRTRYRREIFAKLGLEADDDGDVELTAAFLRLLASGGADYTRAFRALGRVTREPSPADAALGLDPAAAGPWLERYRVRLGRERRRDEERRAAMDAVNPKYILRNALAQRAIEDAERGDFREIARLLAILEHPFDEQPEHEVYANPPPDWSMPVNLSCSS